MPPLQRVSSGDLITAEQINAMIDAINTLQTQVGGISSGQTNQVVIVDLIPPSGSVQLGHELQVIGQNFRFEAGGLFLYVDDTRITNFTSATDQKLVFNLPTSLSQPVPQAGRAALLTVNNSFTSAQRTLQLLPSITLSGAVDVIFQGTTPTTPAAGSNFTLNFRLRSRASVDTTFSINPVVSIPAWQGSVQVLDQAQAVNASRQIPLAAGQEVPFQVRISIPPATGGTGFNVTVTATSGTVSGNSGALPFTVGNAAPQPDTTITLGFSPASQVFGGGSINATTISLPPGASATVRLPATFTIAGSYELTPVFVNGATNWEALRVAATTPSPMTITAADLQATGSAARTLEFGVRPLGGATNGGIEFRVLRTGQAQPRVYPMNVNLI